MDETGQAIEMRLRQRISLARAGVRRDMMRFAAHSDAVPAHDAKESPMTAITLRNISPKLQEAIRTRAGKDGLSLNKAVLRMLEEALGQRHPARELHYELDHLAGTWSAEEAATFDAALLEQRSVDPEAWE
jgi:hypothetical protein